MDHISADYYCTPDHCFTNNMLAKLTILAGFLAIAAPAYNGPLAGGLPAAQFPAGVNPQACPNYPNCENPAVAVSQGPVSQYNAIPTEYKPQFAPQQYNAAPRYTQPQYAPQPQQYAPQPQQYAPQPQQYAPQPQQFAPQYAPAPQPQYNPQTQGALDRGEYIGDGDYHGEGLAEALAPGYEGRAQSFNAAPPQAAYNQQAYQPQVPAGVRQAAQIPAGVDASSCPNYPFCH